MIARDISIMFFLRIFHKFQPAILLANHRLPTNEPELHSFSSRIRAPAQLRLARTRLAF